MEVAREFPGVTKVVDVEGEGQLEVRGEFSTFELTKELKKIEESVETVKIGPDEVTEPKAMPHQQDKGERPINIQEPSKPPNVDASSSNWTGLWEQAKFIGAAAAGQAKVIGVGAAEKAKAIGAVAGLAAEQAKVMGVGAAEKAKAIRGGAVGYLEKRKMLEKYRLHNEWLKKEDMKQMKIWKEQLRILQEKEEEIKQKKILQEEKMRKQDLANKSEGGTTQGSTTTGLWKSISTLSTGQTSASKVHHKRGKRNRNQLERKGRETNLVYLKSKEAELIKSMD